MSYIQRLEDAIRQLHGCEARHVQTVPIHERFRGRTVWSGKVEVFDLQDHPQASQCYAWAHPEENNGERFITVLKIQPVINPRTAVRAAIVSQVKNNG